jgi:hypothetical protein
MSGAARWEPDRSAMLLRLAKRLEDDGVEHPVEAAVVLTVRGRRGLTRQAMAAELDIDEAVLTEAEAGTMRVWDWPRPLWSLVEREVPAFATLLHPARAHPSAGPRLRSLG